MARRDWTPVIAAALVSGTLAGCGFHPLYQAPSKDESGSPVLNDLAAVGVSPIADRTGQILRNQLTTLLDPGGTGDTTKRYTLDVELKQTVNTFGIERSGLATRANVEIVATYKLTDDSSGEPVFDGISRAFTGYFLLNDDFSTFVASGDAQRRAVTQIAYEIRNRVSSYFTTQQGAAPGPT